MSRRPGEPPRGAWFAEGECPGGGRPIVCSSRREDEGSRRMNQWKEPTMRKWWPLVAICAGACMLLVDVTIVNVALPDMARQLNTTFSDLQWVIDLYALVLGALVLTVGRGGGPLRAPQALPHRAGALRRRVARLRPGAERRPADRRARRPGRGRRGDVRDDDGADQQHLYRARARHGLRHLGGGQRGRVRGGADHRRAAHRELRLAVDLPGQPAGQRRRRRADPAGRHRVRATRTPGGSTCRAWRPSPSRPPRSPTRSSGARGGQPRPSP